ncbi:MAG: PaaI family thioesterase [Actinobacteria bacterium]|nr:PaaI family thioesterase [Actinomycetota bacterium]
MTIRHHELCFGCGQANLFGIQLELEPAGEGRVAGRFFLKQDHQGPPGVGHGGIVATALDEAMALAVHHAGVRALTRRLEVDLLAPARVGSFVSLSAGIAERSRDRLVARAVAEGEPGEVLAEAVGHFVTIKR